MSLIIGSARIAETGHAGWEGTAQAGDQKQTSSPDYKGEVSLQSYYTSSKGWYVFRAKDPEVAEKIATQMIHACNNANIGYDQSQRDTLWNYIKANNITDIAKVASKVETDCSALVRACVYVVTGKDVGNIRTVTMPTLMPKSGLFLDTITYKSGVTLYNGDILVTKTTGHTVIVCSGNPRKVATVTESAEPAKASAATTTVNTTTSTSSSVLSCGTAVKDIQTYLNKNYAASLRSAMGDLLDVDGDAGPLTRKGVAAAIQCELNKKGAGLEVDGDFGKLSQAAFEKYVGTIKYGSKGIFVTLLQILCRCFGITVSGGVDGDFGSGTQAAVNALLKKKGRTADGNVTGADMNAMI